MSHATERDDGGQSGAAAVEFALIMIPLVLILFGIIEFGLAYNRQQGMHAGSREAARVASIGASYADVADAFESAVDTIATADLRLNVTVTEADGTQYSAVPGAGGFAAPSDGVFGAGEPCDGADEAERVQVTVRVSDSDKYGVSIPFGPIVGQDFESKAVFVCEPRSP